MWTYFEPIFPGVTPTGYVEIEALDGHERGSSERQLLQIV